MVLGVGLWGTGPARAGSIPYNIDHIEDFLDDSTYFNGWNHVETINLHGTWNYTVIGFESSHWNWIHEGGSYTFATWNRNAFGNYNSVNFDNSNLYFQDSGGPYNVALDTVSNNNFFELYQLTSASNTRSFLNNPITLADDSIIVGFNDNGFGPRIGDADFDDIIIVLTPGQGGSFSPVPEPGTMLLLGCGLVGLAGVSRRRFKK